MLPRQILVLCALFLVAVACSDNSSLPAEDVTETAATLQPTAATTEPSANTGCGRSLVATAAPDAVRLSSLEGRIAFVCDGQIWTMLPNGQDQKQLTSTVTLDWPRIRLYRLPSDSPPSDDERKLYENAMNSKPTWLADGRVVFSSIRDSLALSSKAPQDASLPFVGATELYAINADGTGEKRLTDYNLNPASYPGTFRPTECQAPNFCFAGLLGIGVLDAHPQEPLLAVALVEIRFSECCFLRRLLRLGEGGSELLGLTDMIPDVPPDRVMSLSWADDGSALVLVDLRESVISGPFHVEIRLYKAGIGRTLVAAGEGRQFAVIEGATFSPDGTNVAFCALADDTKRFSLYIMSVALAQPKLLTEIPMPVVPSGSSLTLLSSCSPSWSADGAYLILETLTSQIAIVEVSSGNLIPIANGRQPDWGR